MVIGMLAVSQSPRTFSLWCFTLLFGCFSPFLPAFPRAFLSTWFGAGAGARCGLRCPCHGQQGSLEPRPVPGGCWAQVVWYLSAITLQRLSCTTLL